MDADVYACGKVEAGTGSELSHSGLYGSTLRLVEKVCVYTPAEASSKSLSIFGPEADCLRVCQREPVFVQADGAI